MATKEKRVSRKINLGRRDHQVTPVDNEAGGQKRPAETKEIKTVSKQVETKKTERELKRIKKIEEERMKAIDKDNRRMKRRMLRKQFRKDIVKTSSESWSTFCFVFVVGSTLLGGGTALIIGGRENNVFDFIVVGATGVVCGIIFTITGLYLLIRPVYDKHTKRKAAGTDSWGEQSPEDPTKPYIGKERAEKLKSQIHDTNRQQRSPSRVELYGDDASFDNVTTMTTPRDESFTSYTNPPFLAVPNNEKETFTKKPVLLLNAKEPRSPEKEKQPKQVSGDLSVAGSSKTSKSKNSKTSSFSYENETNHRAVSFSQDYVNQYSTEKHTELNKTKTDKRSNKLDGGVSCNSKNEIYDIDNILKHPSRNTIVIDYSLLNDLGSSPTTSRESSAVAGSDVNHYQNSNHSHKDIGLADTTNQSLALSSGADGEQHPDLTEKLYEKYPEIAEKHKKRSRRHKRHSEKSIRKQQTQAEITVPLEDSENEAVDSIC